ncbi:MAG: ATP-dependent Clp protease ATP-binding subunit [Bacteroidetes bacterium]|nr:ATP-dependent Clp protease ATP-binding subunit [Bacteroidota bacterium]
MDIIFSDVAKELMNKSRKEAEALGTPALMPEHMLLSMIDNERSYAYRILVNIMSKPVLDEIRKDLKKDLANRIYPNEICELAKGTGRIQLTEDFIIMLKQAKSEALSISNDNIVCSEHLLLSMLKNRNLIITQYLNEKGLSYGLARSNYSSNMNISNNFDDYKSNMENDNSNASYMYEKNKEETKTTLLNSISKNLNELAKKDKLDPVIGRNSEIFRTAQVLSRRKKNNVLLIGQPGVGKTAIAEGLALEIEKGRVSPELCNKTIMALDMASLVAGTKYRGQFEERIKELIEELTQNPDIILFIDEIHTIIGAGGVGGGALDASNMLKPVLTDGRVQCIGATTINEYKQHIEKDGAFARRFHAITVEQPNTNETLEILNNIKHKYEKYHGVVYTQKALNACVTLSDRYINDRFFPDKAIDAMDEAGALINIKNSKQPTALTKIQDKLKDIQEIKNKVVNSQKYEEAANLRDKERKLEEQLSIVQKKWVKKRKAYKYKITDDDIAKVIAQTAKVPINKINKQENYNLANMGKVLKKKIIGQSQSIDKIVKSIQRAKIGLRSHVKPIGSFIFLGPTGVGKTSLAKEIANQIFGKPDALIRLDMSEFMEKYSVSGLIGAPPGYVGYEEGGQLTEKVYRTPHSVVLLDEIEKAHPDVQNILLQIMDEGFVTDTLGRKVDFRNTIIVMTSNIGIKKYEEFGSGIGFHTNADDHKNKNEEIKSIIHKEVKNYFSPEFLGRLDDILIFNQLDKEQILKIVNIHLDELNSRIENLGYKIKIDTKTKEFLAEKGYSTKYGVRPILKTIREYIEDPITEKIITNDIKSGNVIMIKSNKASEMPLVDIEAVN